MPHHLPENEEPRLRKLRDYEILDTGPEAAFDDLARLAALICDAPISLISVADTDRLWFKSHFGLNADEIPREGAFCSYTILSPDDVFIVEDAAADERFRENPLVLNAPHVRSYAGAPLLTSDGFALGTLCVIDYKPRKFSPAQAAALVLLTKQVVSQFELRRATLVSETTARRYRQLLEHAADGIHTFDFDGKILAVNPKFCEMTGRSESELLQMRVQDLLSPEDLLSQPLRFDEMRSGQPFGSERQFQRPDGTLITVELSVKKIDDDSIQAIARDVTVRRRTEQKLVEAERRFRDFNANSLALFCTHDLAGSLLSINPAASKALGYAEDELVGKNLAQLLSPDASGILPDYLRQIRSEGESRGLMHIRTKAGELRVWSYSNLLRTDAEGSKYVLASAQDVTDLTKAESELRALFSAMTEVVIVLDKDGRYVKIPPTNPNLLYRPPDEILGKTLHEVFPQEQADYFFNFVQAALETNETQRFDYSLEIEGREIWFAGAMTPMTADTVLIVARDITERKRAAQKLAESENRFRSYINNSPAVIFLKDELGHYVTVNRTFEKLLNVRFEDLGGKTDFDILPKDVALAVRANDRIVLDTEAPLKAEEFVPAPDGTPHYWISHKFLIKDASGKRYVGGVAINITERKEMETDLETARDAALESARLKSAFLSNVSHEIRTPMNGVIGMTELLLATPLDRAQREYAEVIRQSGDALLTVINDILDLAKIEAGKLRFETTDFDVRQTVESTVELLAERAYRKNLEIASLIGSDVPIILRGDAGRLRQVLTNLVGNAVKYTDAGEIGVIVKLEKIEGNSIFLRFTVADTGIGIAEDDIRHLFQPFVQVDNSPTRRFGGTGLGLVISKQIVEMMDGEITVKSEPGKGSEFSFTASFEMKKTGYREIKKTDPSSVLHEKNIIVADAKAGTGGGLKFTANATPRLLVVEDNEVNRRVILLQLEQIGITADIAVDGVEALKKIAARDYRVILMDCQMPLLDGFETTREMRRREQKRRELGEEFAPAIVIALTAHSLAGEREKCLAAGMNDYLAKPVRIADLSAVRQILSEPPTQSKPLNRAIDFSSIKDFDDEIIQLYLSETARRIEELEEAFELGESGEIARLAHAVRGNALAIKDVASAAIAVRLEECGLQRDVKNIPELLQSLRNEILILNSQFAPISNS